MGKISAPDDRAALAQVYEGLEKSFADDASRAAYRAAMLARTAEQADLLGVLLDSSSVLEIACGNGRLLIELARRGLLSQGLGVDTARSRIAFATAWAHDLGLEMVHFEAADALELKPPSATYDAIVCITGAFAYFEPLGAGTDWRLLTTWASALRPGGLLVLELYPHPELMRLLGASGGRLRSWRELGPEDPWRYYLSEFELQESILVHHKTFIHRSNAEVDEGRVERLKIYSVDEVVGLLKRAGFSQIRCRDGWTDRAYEAGESMVVTARQPNAE